MKPEKRLFEVRKFSEADGTFEAYAATWDTVDSFGTRFKRGAFRKTLQERLKRGDIKLLWQHKMDEPIGLVLDAKEDDIGLLIHGQLDIGVARADQARLQMRSGTINQFSFGFDIIKQQKAKDGFIDISEVRMWEASPVTFGANPETSVLNVRSHQFVQGDEIQVAEGDVFFTESDGEVHEVGKLEMKLALRTLQLLNAEYDKKVGEELEPKTLPGSADGSLSTGSSSTSSRATDFDETFDGAEMATRWYRILDALGETIWDILYSGQTADIVTAADEAFEKAHAKFVAWANELMASGTRAMHPLENELSGATRAALEGKALEDVAQDSPLSVDELSQLLRGEILPISSRGRVAEFSQAVADAHLKVRGDKIISLFEEIRAKGFSQPQLMRLGTLLSSQLGVEPDEQDHTAVLESLRALNQTYN